ncbi:hypothetical protein H8B15_00070 [Hymenobacter sp. BT507]|uniref:DUF1795 domain-containing protein n=1 Tax=Hymenobacter citatus TaxID=2763506 RepID=A0ABR7MFB9_9BACT|nr:hypothetical protein [Hymenobacter citatus]MBC6609298.1 hypothetical protein [Hymenobacter citatus]
MKLLRIVLFIFLGVRSLNAQQPLLSLVKKYTTIDDTGQKISFELPVSWSFEDGLLRNSRKAKVGEFTSGVIADYPFASGADFIQQLKAGYPDDAGNPTFIGSRTLTLGRQTWTEGIRQVPLWDGKTNAKRWYTHDFFTVLNRKCFLITFYSTQKVLPEELNVRQILASIKLL